MNKPGWKKSYESLLVFALRHGHSSPHASYETDDGVKLGRWVVKQRSNKEDLDVERLGMLESLPNWVWSPRQAWWEEGIQHLIHFMETDSLLNLKTDYVCKDGFNLGGWVKTQRDNWNTLDEVRQKRLCAIEGWTVDPSEEIFHIHLKALRKYCENSKSSSPPTNYITEDGLPLGPWCASQRSQAKKRNYPSYRRQALDQVEGWTWDIRSNKWDDAFHELEAFITSHGHCKVPQKFKQGDFALGTWVGIQRSQRDKMPLERRQKLDNIGFIWDPLTEAWEEGFRKLEQFKRAEGHCRVASGYIQSGFRLGQWVKVQRRSKSKMDSKRLARLDAMNFPWLGRNS